MMSAVVLTLLILILIAQIVTLNAVASMRMELDQMNSDYDRSK